MEMRKEELAALAEIPSYFLLLIPLDIDLGASAGSPLFSYPPTPRLRHTDRGSCLALKGGSRSRARRAEKRQEACLVIRFGNGNHA